jgi:addiction module HigA family antidote
MQMYDPAHPGMLIRDQMGGRSIAELAKHLGVTRAALSRVINGKAAVSAEMALRLEGAFGIKADLWLASRKKLKKVTRLQAAPEQRKVA